MHVPGSEQMGYRGTKERMHCSRRKPRTEASLMESEKIQGRDPFLLTTHRAHEASNPAPSRKHHDVTETIIMSHVPGNEEVEEKEDLSLPHDLALLFVMKEHIWDRSSNSMEKDTSEERERGRRDLENWAELLEGKRSLSRGQPSLKESRDSSLTSLDGEFAAHSSSSPQSSLLDAASPALTSPRRASVGQMESQVLDARFCQTPSPYDTPSQTWREEPATTDTLLAQEESVSESPLVIHDISNCHKNADFLKTSSEEDHSWELETQHKENGNLSKGMDIVMSPNEISFQREEASKRLGNPSEEEESSLDVAQRKAGSISCHLPSKAGTEDGSLEQNESSCPILRLQEEEESEMRVSSPLLVKENVQTHHSKSNMNCDGSESGQKEPSTAAEPESAELGALELAGSEEGGEKAMNWKEVRSQRKTNLGEVESGRDDHEERGWAMQATAASRTERAPTPIILDRDTLDSSENSLAPSGVNNNSSVVGSEESAFSCKEVSSAGRSPRSVCVLPESRVQTTAFPLAGMAPAGSGSPRIRPPVYHSSRQLEHSGTCDKANNILCCDQDGAQLTVGVGEDDIEKEDSKSSGKEESVRSADYEQITRLFTDLALAIDPQNLYDSQPTGHSFDAEKSPVPSLRAIAAAALQEDASKEATGGTVTCAGDKSVLHLSGQLGRAIREDASALDGDGDGRLPTFGKDFPEDAQSSTSKVPPSPSLEESLSDIAKEMVKLSLCPSVTTRDSVQDTTESYVENFPQQLQPTSKNAMLSEEEAAADTFCTEQDIVTTESPCFSVLEEDRTECDRNADSLPSSRTLSAVAADAAQLTQPLAPVPVGDSEQTLVLELASLLSSRKPLQFVSRPPPANFDAQPIPPGLLPRHPDQLLEQPSCPSQADPFLAPRTSATQTVLERSAVTPEARSPEEPPTSGSDLSLCCRAPRSVHGSKESHDASSPIASKRAAFPSRSGGAAFQRTNSRHITQPTAAGLGNNLLTQHPLISLSGGSHSPQPDSRSRKHLTVGGNPFAQHGAEASESHPLVSCTGSDEQTHTSLLVDNLVYWTSPSISETGDLAHISSLGRRVEETSAVPLATSAEADTPQGQEGMDKTCPELGFYLSDLQGDLLGNGTTVADSFSCVPETMSKCADVHDGRSSHHTSHPSGDREKLCETRDSRNVKQTPSLLAFTNPMHFLQLGPPSPPTARHPGVPRAGLQEPQWQERQTRPAEDPVASPSEGPGRVKKALEKSGGEPVHPPIHRKDAAGRHPRLEKSSSCPDKNAIGLGAKEPVFSTKKQEAGIKHRAKSKDWHRHGVRKISMPTDSAMEAIASLAHPKEEAPGPKDKADHLDLVKYGEKKTTETIENIKRRHSRLINSSRLLYQEYSDDVLNKAIQSQKRADSLSEEVELGSPKLRRKGLSPQDSYLQRLSVSSGSSLWQDIPMVRGSTMLLSMTREEQKLQEAKFELIASEASYLRSLNVAVDHFQHCQELQGLLTTQDKQWLFSRLQDVRDVSANFLFELEEKLEENMFTFNVCDVALRNAPEFRRVYLPYVTNQTYQEQTFQRLMNGVPAFQQVLEKLESDPVCQRLSLKSFLILPFQRITRLKLLLQNILKRIPPGADEEIQATQAYDALEKLIKDCNENVQRMKSTEELIHLSQNMEFECKIFPLVSQSRRLVKHGELTALEYNISLKWKLTTRPIYLHLFNDYLLLSRPKENGRFIVFDYAASSNVRGEKCEMKLHGSSKNLLRLFLLKNNQGKKVEFLFRTETQSEKLRWISALRPQQPEPDLLDDSDAPQVQCVKSYKARENDELTLEKADIVMVLRQSSDGWIEGVKLSDAERGWFPSDQVEFISSKHARQMNLKEEQRVKNAKQQVFRKK
ncbi:rho guanine nucleotide exchange factor 5 [Liasis olivaceus]